MKEFKKFEGNLIEEFKILTYFPPVESVIQHRAVPIQRTVFTAVTDNAETLLDFEKRSIFSQYSFLYASHDSVEEALELYPKAKAAFECEEEIFEEELNPSSKAVSLFPVNLVKELDACPVGFSEKEGILSVAFSHHRTKRRQKFLEGRIQKYSPEVKTLKSYVMAFTLEGKARLKEAKRKFYEHEERLFGFSEDHINEVIFGRKVIPPSDPFYVEDVPPFGENHEIHQDELILNPEAREHEEKFWKDVFKDW